MPLFHKNDKRILFIHIPKAGGTSIEQFFKKNGWEMEFYDGGGQGTKNKFTRCSPQHMHFSMLNSLIKLEKCDEIFTFVRAPHDRLLSEYRWRVKFFNETRGLSDWLKFAIRSYSENPFCLDNHLRPQSEFVSESVKVLKLEEGIGEGLKTVLANYDFDFSKLSIEMRANDRAKDAKFNQEERLTVQDWYVEDYRRFGYASL
jgi:hypothetical protein